MIWCWELPEEEESRPYCFVDFWRKPPPLISFGVERHTLAHRRYHPGISPFISWVFSVEGASNFEDSEIGSRPMSRLQIHSDPVEIQPVCFHWAIYHQIPMVEYCRSIHPTILGAVIPDRRLALHADVPEQIRPNPSYPFHDLMRR